MVNLAVFASHNGSGLDTIYNAIKKGDLHCNITLVISNNTDSIALQNASQYKLNHVLVNSKNSDNPNEIIYELLKTHNCTHIFLSGYMKKISPNITNDFKVINSHPSLLPKFGGSGMYGHYVHEAVINAGESISGVTIHEVNEEYDSGKIILQKSLTLDINETAISLESKIKELEKSAITEALVKVLKLS